MKPIGSELFLYNTLKINTESGQGTGFCFMFVEGEIGILVLITNKHVINGNENEKVEITFHVTDNNYEKWDNVTYDIEKIEWYFHPTHDLCFTYLQPIIDNVNKENEKKIFIFPIWETDIFSDEKLNDLGALEEVLMVGYPFGLWDNKNNFPIFRKGITASHPAYDFKGEKGIGLVDMPIFGGSSGSPVFIYNQNGYTNKKGTFNLNGRMIFLGTIYQEYSFPSEGEVKIEEIPTARTITRIRANIGRYIKANEILKFKELIFKK